MSSVPECICASQITACRSIYCVAVKLTITQSLPFIVKFGARALQRFWRPPDERRCRHSGTFPSSGIVSAIEQNLFALHKHLSPLVGKNKHFLVLMGVERSRLLKYAISGGNYTAATVPAGDEYYRSPFEYALLMGCRSDIGFHLPVATLRHRK